MVRSLDTAVPAAPEGSTAAGTLDDLIPYAMNRIVSRLNRTLDEKLRRRGLSFQHWRVLAVLAAADGLSIAELSEAAVIPHSTLSRLLGRMERDRLVARRSGPGDLRLVGIWLTAEGRGTYREILPIAQEVGAQALRGLNAAEQSALGRTLQGMMANIGLKRIDEMHERTPE